MQNSSHKETVINEVAGDERVLCLVCRDPGIKSSFVWRNRAHLRCRACGAITQESPLSEQAGREFYGEHYYQTLGELNPAIQAARRKLYEDALKRLEPYRRAGRLLDIGSGFGDFLRLAHERAWEVWGVEPSREAYEASCRVVEGRLFHQMVEDADLPQNYFDVITLWDVLDYLPDPEETLKRVREWLAPGGLVMIRVPNAWFHWRISVIYKRARFLLEGLGWKKDPSVFKRINFEAKTARQLLKTAGFSRLQITNGEPTQGDPYRVFARSSLVWAMKAVHYAAARAAAWISGGKIFLGSNLLICATKGRQVTAAQATASGRGGAAVPVLMPSQREGIRTGGGPKGRPLTRSTPGALEVRIFLKRVFLHALAVLGYVFGLPFWNRLMGRHRNIRILLYHSIEPMKSGDMAITVEEFARHVDFLKERYPLISVDEAVDHLKQGTLPDQPSAVITFDDGYASNYQYAFPLLRRRNLKAGVFLLAGGDRDERTANHLGDEVPQEKDLLRWDEVREMAAEGFVFGSHGVSHGRFADLSEAEKIRELASSKKRIEEELGTPVRYFSYPYGTRIDFDAATESLVRTAGYDAAFSKIFGSNSPKTDLLALRRMGVEASDTLFTLRAKLNGALGLLVVADLPWIRKAIRWFDANVLRLMRSGPRTEAPILLVSVDFPPHTDGVSTISRELTSRLSAKGVSLVVIGPADVGARDYDSSQSYRTYRVPGYALGILRFVPILFCMPWVVLRHKVREVFCMNIAYGGILAWFLSFLVPLEYVLFAYGYEFEKVRQNPVLRWLYLKIYGRAKKVICCSRTVQQRLVNFGVPDKKTAVLYPAVDFKRYRPCEIPPDYLKKHGLGGRRILLTVGRLVLRKGQDQVSKALRRVVAEMPDVLYCVVGIGEDEEILRQQVRMTGMEGYVRFFGKVTDEELVWLYNACEIFVMPSREMDRGGHMEGFGIVYLEANACGKPVIGGRSGGVAEAVRDGETGFLVDPLSSQEIAEKILFLLSHSGEARAMGRRGLEWVRASFDWQNYVQRAYSELTGKGIEG